MGCSPEREGLAMSFTDFAITPPLGKALHDLS
jgi:regulation of enolase protein 1 (concanavalin A-like superfamily)